MIIIVKQSVLLDRMETPLLSNVFTMWVVFLSALLTIMQILVANYVLRYAPKSKIAMLIHTMEGADYIVPMA